MASSFAGVTIKVLRDSRGRSAIPEPVGTPIVRTPLVNGGTNVQVPGARVLGVTLTLEFATNAAYVAMLAKIGTAGTLILTPGSLTLTYPNALLETVSSVSIGRDKTINAQARFTMDGY